MTKPKAFISYSWSNATHEAWVLSFATELRESGVDAILDKWDLREGQDAHAFMERMVSDPEIRKVILVCDSVYARKAAGREGGVGTEAQIISAEIYANQAQQKFVAVVRERDEQGKPFLPPYYASRIFIDLSDDAAYADNFEQLIRWIHDAPLHKRPELGQKPAFLEPSNSTPELATSARFKRAIDAVRSGRDYASGAVEEFLVAFSSEMEKLRLPESQSPEFDEAVLSSITDFVPYRNQTIEMFLALSRYRDSEDSRSQLHRFFERLLLYLDDLLRPSSGRADLDNYRFLIHEMFLYCVASLLRHERFDSVDHLLRVEYFYAPDRTRFDGTGQFPFAVFRRYTPSLEARNKRLSLSRLALRADLLEQRCTGVGLQFRELMEADFVLFMRDRIDRPEAQFKWWPETLLYADRDDRPFAVFARAKSKAYFDRAKVLLGVGTRDQLAPLLDEFRRDPKSLPRWSFESFSPAHLLGFDQLASRP